MNEEVASLDRIENSTENFRIKARKYYSRIYEKITKLNAEDKVVHGYGASHRTFVLLGNAGLFEQNVPIIYDNNTFLHNKRLNGFESLVLSTSSIIKNQPDAIVIFATAYEQEIVDFLVQECKYSGEIISLKYEAICSEY